jgi:hypothetical protein
MKKMTVMAVAAPNRRSPEELAPHGLVGAVLGMPDSPGLELAQAVTLERVEDRVEHPERNGGQRGDEHLVADDRVAIPVHENVGVEALVLVHAKRAVLHEAERRVVFADDVRGEVDGVEEPGHQEDAPAARGQQPRHVP